MQTGKKRAGVGRIARRKARYATTTRVLEAQERDLRRFIAGYFQGYRVGEQMSARISP